MKTPIRDFVKAYAESGVIRLHMPGHKGIGDIEKYDITEIPGADSLWEAGGIIRESEKNAGELFGCQTFYSTEGSSHAIRAMLHIVNIYARKTGKKPWILAGRNAHKTFVGAAALLGIDVEWLAPAPEESYLSCGITGDRVREYLDKTAEKPTAVYITSPDYLGKIVDIRSVSEACREAGVLLLVDNAHGAYLKFLESSLHPIDLGADMCCDSAHKTLPSLTGGAYLHISRSAPECFSERAKDALALFGSTSPSYLILASLDGVNAYISDGYREKLASFVAELDKMKARITSRGYELYGDEPLKMTICAKSYGYFGVSLAEELSRAGIVSEFADPDFTVFMFTPETKSEELLTLERALTSIEKRKPIRDLPPRFAVPKRRMTMREAMAQDFVELPVSECLGKTLAAVTVGCPPAVPILVFGETIDEASILCFEYYGVKSLKVVNDD